MPYNIELPDGRLVEGIPDEITPEQAKQRILKAFPDVAAEEERTWGEAIVDPLAGLGVGAGRLLQLPGQIGQLAGLYEADEAGTGLQGLGQRLEAFSQEAKSPTLVGREQLRAQEMAQAEGFFDELTTFLGQTVTDPMLLTSFFTEQVPNLVGSMGGGLLARGGVKLLMREAAEQSLNKTLGRAGVAGAVGTGAAMQGADVGADTYERIFTELTEQGVPEEEANQRALTQAREAAILAAGATIATSYAIPGGTSIERFLAGKGAPGTGGFVRGTLGEAAQESLEEGAGRLASNVQVAQEIPGTSITEGLGEAVGSGLLAGAMFGGPAGALSGRRDARIQAQLDNQRKEAEARAAAQREAARLEAEAAALAQQEAERRRELNERGVLFSDEELDAGMVAPPVSTAAPRRPAPEVETPTITPEGELELPGMGLGRPTAEVTEADFSRMGIGRTNKKLRAQILGKNLGIPEERDQVRQALEAYASDPNRSARIIEGVESFLRRPEFADQLELDLGYWRKPVTPDVGPPFQATPVITEASLDSLLLPKRSAARKRLLGKDISKPEERAEVVAELKKLAANKQLNEDTRARVRDVLASSPFIRTQGELFTPEEAPVTPQTPVTTPEETPAGETDAGTATAGAPSTEPTVRRRAGERGVGVAGVGAGTAAPTEGAAPAVPTPEGGGLAPTDGGAATDTGRGAGAAAPVEGGVDFISWLRQRGISPTDASQDWAQLEQQWRQETSEAPSAEPQTRTSDNVRDEIEALKKEQLSLLTKNGRRPRSGTAKAARFEAIGQEIGRKMAEWDALDRAERAAAKPPAKEGEAEAKPRTRAQRREAGEYFATFKRNYDESGSTPFSINPDLKDVADYADWLGSLTPEQQAIIAPKFDLSDNPFLNAGAIDPKAARRKFEKLLGIEPNAPIETPATVPVSPEQAETNREIAALYGGKVVFEEGDVALIQTYDKVTADPIYMPVKGEEFIKRDISKADVVGILRMTPEQVMRLSDKKVELEKAERAKHEANPFIKFEDGVAFSSDIPSELREIAKELKRLLGLSPNIYFTTRADALANRDNFTGPHRVIGGDVTVLDPKTTKGTTRNMEDGGYYVTFTPGRSLNFMIETIAHELGHVHEKEVFRKASPEMKKALQKEHHKWVKNLEGKTSGDLIKALRARHTIRLSRYGLKRPASSMSPYWTSFSEWYADQVSRWAVSAEKPQTIVEKFFAKLGATMRRFYNSLKAKGYLPNQTFVEYLEAVSPEITAEDMSDPVVAAWEDMKPEGAPSFAALRPVHQNLWRRLLAKNQASMDQADRITESHRDADLEDKERGAKRQDIMLSQVNPQVTNPILEDISKRAGGIPDAPPPKTAFQKVKDSATRQNLNNFLNTFETRWFSFDAGLSNRIRDELTKNNPDWNAIKEALHRISTSQALHADGVATKFLEKGNARYNPQLHMYEAVEDPNNFIALVRELKDIAEEEGISFDTLKQYANQAFIAERTNSLSKSDKDFYSDLTEDQIKAGLEFFTAIPRLRNVQNIWNGIRANTMRMAVDSGLYTEQEAQDLLNAMDYVPFYRVEQIAAGAGPREYGRGLLDFAKTRKIRGSEQQVNDIFDNMERWASYTISRAVKNRTANNMLEVARDVFPDEVEEIRKDDPVRKEEKQNVIDIYVGGQKRRFKFADPLFVDAFGSMANITMPLNGALGGFAVKAADFLRKTVVLVPLFSISQLSQDSLSGMFTSGLNSPLKLPLEVAKEFVATLRNSSKSHERLADVAAAGIRDYSATVAKNDLEIMAGLQKPTVGRRTFNALEKFAMASDNAVRQAIYNRTLLETGGVRLADGSIRGGDEAMAVRRAFEVINFKRSGNSGLVQVLKQVVPFFGAYLQAQNVAYKVLAGRGISPQERTKALVTLANTTAKVMALAFLYTALVADDEEYKEMDPALRDRTLMIPGTSFRLPLRPDIFLLPKMISEYTYLGLTDDGFTDATKVRRAFKDAIANAVLSPTAVPQAIKPALEVGINYSFFTGRPIVGRGLERLPTELQYGNYTTEIARAIGNTGLMSPVNVDHLMRGYLGTAGGLFNLFVSSAVRTLDGRSLPDVPLPEDIASIPGMSPFVTRPYGTGIKNDFYELRGEVDKAVAGINWLKKYRTREETAKFIEERQDLLRMRSAVNRVGNQLSKLRAQERKVRETPDSRLNAQEKGRILERLREIERRILEQVPELRRRAGL